jgi:hypothetical protein
MHYSEKNPSRIEIDVNAWGGRVDTDEPAALILS